MASTGKALSIARPREVATVEKGLTPEERKQWGMATIELDPTGLKTPYTQHSWVYTAVSKYSDQIKDIPLVLKQGRDTESAKEIEEGELYTAFNKPNSWWSVADLKEATVIWLLTKGNAIWLLDRPSPQAVPKEIWCLPHEMFKPKFLKGTWNISHWEMRNLAGTKTINVPPWDVVFFRLFGPDPFWGMSPLTALKKSLEGDWNAILFNEAFFKNGCIPGGMLTIGKEASKPQIEQIREMMRDRHQGLMRAFKAMVLQEGVAEYTPYTISQKDMDFKELRTMSREEIAGAFKIPPSIMGWKEQTHKATAEKEARDWISGSVKALCRVITDSLRSQFFFDYDQEYSWVEFDFSNLAALQEDLTEKITRADTMFGWGVPVSELNRLHELGIEAYPGWDESLLPISLIPRGSGEGIPPVTPPGGNGKKAIDGPTIDAGETRLITQAPAIRPHTPAEAALWGQWIGKTYPIERKFTADLRDYMLKVRVWFDGHLSRAGMSDLIEEVVEAGPANWLLLPESFDGELRKVGRRAYRKIAEDVGPLIEDHIRAAKIPYAFDIDDARITNFLQQKEIVLPDLNTRMKVRIKNAIEASIRLGETVAELQSDIHGIIGESRARAQTIARTETAQTANGLEHVSYKLAGVKTQQWLAARDDVVRETHLLDMAVGPHPVGTRWPNSQLLYPGDPSGNQEEFINCRCSTIPVE
jgi:HK97 family phage portal protein